MRDDPRRILTDWTTSAGVDGSGLLALVLGGATAEGIHLATLGYEVFVLHAVQAAAGAAKQASHVHHVVADPAALPEQWRRRFDLVVAIDAESAVEQVADAGLLFVVAESLSVPPGMTAALHERIDDPDHPGVGCDRAVLVRLP